MPGQCGDVAAGLENIPVEILYVLAEKIANKTDLLHLRLVSRSFDNVLVPYIYQMLSREVQLRTSMHLHRAAATCYDLAIQRLLSANVSPNCQDEVGETALHVAVRNNCFVSVRRLVHAGASVDARSYNQWTPVHFAARYGQVSVLRELIRNTADVNLRGFHGWTALHYAARSGYLEAIELLLSAGAEVNALDNDKRTAAQEAIQFHHYDVLRVLEDDPMR